MEEKTQLSGVNLFFLWFGAAVSVAEILTGGYLAELGAVKGLWAILLGHLAGTLLLVLAGLIGFREKTPRHHVHADLLRKAGLLPHLAASTSSNSSAGRRS